MQKYQIRYLYQKYLIVKILNTYKNATTSDIFEKFTIILYLNFTNNKFVFCF